MSYLKTVTYFCDVGGCVNTFDTRITTVAEARTAAHLAGWKHLEANRSDMCPRCRGLEEAT